MRFRFSMLLLLALATFGSVQAAPASFDLVGPKLKVVVTRGTQILPISEVPNLNVGDRLWIKADLPSSQSANYELVAAFLSGATNPPPKSWFFPCKTWTGPCKRDGLTVTVPQGAQQVVVFLAPEASGGFSTLVDAVRGRPGAFVRASQDLNQASLDRSRLDRYLAAVHVLDTGDPARLKEAAPLLARSLAIKVDAKCLDRIPSLQASCLMEGQESLILSDGHSNSIVEALTSGPGSDLVLQASSTPQLGLGYYSPYIGSVIDILRILDSFGTAQYQYIPALGSQLGNEVSLTLNTPPSFHDPRSVLVIALPAVEQPQPPPLHAVDPNELYCASRKTLVLPVEGAPLVFSTTYSHDVTLSLRGQDGKTIELPATPDAVQGGYVVDTSRLRAANLGDTVRGTLRGYWGFEPYEGPSFGLWNAHAKNWTLADGDSEAVIVGRQDTIHLRADSSSCVDSIMLRDPAGKELKADWKAVKPGEVEVKLPLQGQPPGALTLMVSQYGAAQPIPIPIRAFSDAGHFDSFEIHSGDAQGTLSGSRLDLVESLSIGNVSFTPLELTTVRGTDRLSLVAADPIAAAALMPGNAVAAKVMLKDGRVVRLNAAVATPRPRASLIGKNIAPSPSSGVSNIRLANPDQLPQDARLMFSLRTDYPASFSRDESVEVAVTGSSISTTLTLENGGLRLVDAKVAVGSLEPAKAFGLSAFGPLQFRVVANGSAAAVTGNWQPLATLVRLPMLKSLKCPTATDTVCTLYGTDLYLIDSVAGEPTFDHPSQVPDGFPGTAILVPRPLAGQLYLKLRDDPSTINTVTLDVQTLPPSADDLARAAATTSGVSAAVTSPVPPAPPSAAAAGPSQQPLAAPASAPQSAVAIDPAPKVTGTLPQSPE